MLDINLPYFTKFVLVHKLFCTEHDTGKEMTIRVPLFFDFNGDEGLHPEWAIDFLRHDQMWVEAQESHISEFLNKHFGLSREVPGFEVDTWQIEAIRFLDGAAAHNGEIYIEDDEWWADRIQQWLFYHSEARNNNASHPLFAKTFNKEYAAELGLTY